MAYLAVRRLALGFFTTHPLTPPNEATLGQVLMTVPWVIAAYLGLLLVPWWSGPAHRVMFVTSVGSPQFYVPVALLCAVGVAFWLWVRRHPRRRLYLFCAAWIGVAIAPVVLSLGALLNTELVHDGYLYMASAGWCVLVADWAVQVVRRGVVTRRIACGAAAAAALVCAAALWNVQRFWHDELAYAARCVEIFPESARTHLEFAIALRDSGDLPGAERELSRALSIEPANGSALYWLGVVHSAQGRVRQGAAELAQGLERMTGPVAGAVFRHETPDLWATIARLYDSAGDQRASDTALARAASLPGGSIVAELAHADLKRLHGDLEGAEQIERALVLRYPNDPRGWAALGVALAAQDRNEEALSAYERALKLVPADASIDLLAATALHKMGRDGEALEHCRRVLAVTPNDPNARALAAAIERASSAR
ncbi:MAG: tetratricopeptide repeat protein [Candidatus Binataceae bacterium]